jgi:NAD(P)-dependent dehydrogenase (short-subunit alcohol dehydrogenase family)
VSGSVDPAALFGLEGRVAVVTGASSGLGVELAGALAGAGARLVLAARRAEMLAERVAALEARGVEARAVACDISKEPDVDRLVEQTLDHFGRADVLVNNAGITDVVPAVDHGLESWQRICDVNLTGLFLCAQRFGRVMIRQGSGSIVNVSSILGLVGSGQVTQAAYAATKGAVVNLTRELGAEWARTGVRVNGIAPGWFPSEMTGDMFQDERSLKWMRSRTPMGRGGRPGELAGALLLLASDAGSFLCGQTIAVDGGWTAV